MKKMEATTKCLKTTKEATNDERTDKRKKNKITNNDSQITT
jgi:hypothetical protein